MRRTAVAASRAICTCFVLLAVLAISIQVAALLLTVLNNAGIELPIFASFVIAAAAALPLAVIAARLTWHWRGWRMPPERGAGAGRLTRGQ